jgi:membrane protease YdiL (CAAX protease family)
MFGYITTTFIFGLFFGYFYSKARNIVPLIITHGLHNSFFLGIKMNQTALEAIGNLPLTSLILIWLTPYILSGMLTLVFIKYAVREL